MHLTKVILENFQSHSYSEFNLDPHLNIISGISNQGKTSLVRALSLVLFNFWDRSWTRNGEKFCKVTIQTDTGIIVERQKGDKVNKYILTLPGAQSQTYENFGVTTPEAVQKSLRIHEVQIDSKDSINLNLSTQLESLFLLSQPNSYKAKVFGKLSGAHILDSAIRELNREGRGYSTEKGIKEKELVELQGQVDKLAQIERFSTDVAEIEARLASVALQEGRLQQIRGLLERVKGWKADWLRQTTIEGLLSKVDLSVLSKLPEKVDKFNKLYTLSGLLSQCKANFDKQNAIQSLLTSVSLDIIPDMVYKVGRNKILQDLSNKIAGNNAASNTTSKIIKEIEEKHEEATKQYSDKLKEVGICPICGISTKDLTNV